MGGSTQISEITLLSQSSLKRIFEKTGKMLTVVMGFV